MNDIDKVKQTKRQSGIELLRIISMFMVLLIHANAWGEKWGNLDLTTSFASSTMTILWQTLSCVCVNIFVLISGWFGIKFSYRGLAKFLFQCFFFLFGIYLVVILLGIRKPTIEGLAGCFMFLKWNWFIKAYLLLYIISPILNRFLDATNKKELKVILVLFFTIQTIYGWLTNGAFFFEYGLSVTSFVGLYLLAQYVRRFLLYTSPLNLICVWGGKFLMCFIIFFLVLFAIAMASVYWKVDFITGKIFAYTSPFVIINSLLLLLLFIKLDRRGFSNKVINRIAASSFAVFLLHTNPSLFVDYYQNFFIQIYYLYPWYSVFLLTMVILVVIFAIAITIDQIRIYCWKKIEQFCLKHGFL